MAYLSKSKSIGCSSGQGTVDVLNLLVYTVKLIMRKAIHPSEYRAVVFQDLNDNTTYLTRSTVATNDTITIDGVKYPLVKIHISSSSHPFYTGQEKLVDIEGRVDKFEARRKAAAGARAARSKAVAKQIASKQPKVKKATQKTIIK